MLLPRTATALISTLVTFQIIDLVTAIDLPDFIKPCSISDPKLNACVTKVASGALKQFSKGIPELDVPSLDPAHLSTIVIRAPGLSINYNDTILTGLGDGKMENIKVNLKKMTLKMEYVANLRLRGKYRVNGRILILPVIGEGDYTNDIKNIRIKTKYNLHAKAGEDGKEHWSMSIAKSSFTVGGAHFNLKNLFNGNRVIGDTTLHFLNENWEFIMNEIAPPAVDQIVNLCLETVNKFYSKVPYEALFTP